MHINVKARGAGLAVQGDVGEVGPGHPGDLPGGPRSSRCEGGGSLPVVIDLIVTIISRAIPTLLNRPLSSSLPSTPLAPVILVTACLLRFSICHRCESEGGKNSSAPKSPCCVPLPSLQEGHCERGGHEPGAPEEDRGRGVHLDPPGRQGPRQGAPGGSRRTLGTLLARGLVVVTFSNPVVRYGLPVH